MTGPGMKSPTGDDESASAALTGVDRKSVPRWLRHAVFYLWIVTLCLAALATDVAALSATKLLLLELALTGLSPLLYYICFKGTLTARQMLVRLMLVFCFGAFVSSKIIPPDAASAWSPSSLRMYVLGVVIAIEVFVVVRVIKLLFAGKSDARDVVTETGAPLWVAKLMLLEAKFWRGLWRISAAAVGRTKSAVPPERSAEDRNT